MQYSYFQCIFLSRIKIIIINIFQSDVVHQSVFELVHSEDREELQRQLVWNSFLTPDQNMPLQVRFSIHVMSSFLFLLRDVTLCHLSSVGHLECHIKNLLFSFSVCKYQSGLASNFHSKILSNEQ